jgi:hypothetical protein
MSAALPGQVATAAPTTVPTNATKPITIENKKEPDAGDALNVEHEHKIRPFNGWTKELEVLFAEWADKAACYRWMHDKTGRMFQARDQGFMFPIIILSTVGGAANFAMNSISQDPTIQKYIQLGLGGLSIATGILTTIANRLGYASSSEAHRGASISWGKFNRLIVIELSLHPDERMEAFAFMKMFRIELDRLIEQSPTIPEAVINNFIYEFKETLDVKKPDITGDLEHTRVFSDSNTRLKQLAQDAAMTLNLKKGILKQLVLDDLDAKIRKMVASASANRGSPAATTTGTPSFSINVRGHSPIAAPIAVPVAVPYNQNPSKTPTNKAVLPILVSTVKRPGSSASSVSEESVSVDVEQGIPNVAPK